MANAKSQFVKKDALSHISVDVVNLSKEGATGDSHSKEELERLQG